MTYKKGIINLVSFFYLIKFVVMSYNKIVAIIYATSDRKRKNKTT